jgi:beta-phosphoglucomutase-like phosphatase (HAD superfamily)
MVTDLPLLLTCCFPNTEAYTHTTSGQAAEQFVFVWVDSSDSHWKSKPKPESDRMATELLSCNPNTCVILLAGG